MGVTETLLILLTIFLSTACIQNVRLFGVYDVHWPFLIEIHTAPLKRFVPSSVLHAVRALRNAPAASAVFLACGLNHRRYTGQVTPGIRTMRVVE